MALINEHIVKEKILSVVSDLIAKYEYDSDIIGFTIVKDEDYQNILDDLSKELDKILK